MEIFNEWLFGDRAPLLGEHILFIADIDKPDKSNVITRFIERLWSMKQDRECNVEVCSGNGDWIIEKALLGENTFWIGIEYKIDRVMKIYKKLKTLHIENVMLICGDARKVFDTWLPRSIVDAIYVNYPDPWPKNKHRKNRLNGRIDINDRYYNALNAKGFLYIATDVLSFLKESVRNIDTDKWSLSVGPIRICDAYGDSYFKRRGESRGDLGNMCIFIKR